MRNNIFYCKSHFSYLATAIEERFAKHRQPFFGTKLKVWRYKMFKLFSSLLLLICFFVRNVSRLESLCLFYIRSTGTHICRGFKAHDLITRKSKFPSHCFPRELLSFTCPQKLLSFDPWHVACSPSLRKHLWVGRYNSIWFYIVIGNHDQAPK